MCLGIPGKVISIGPDQTAEIDYNGVVGQASLALIPEVQVGDYVIVHVGFAIQKLSEADAQETISLLQEFFEPQEKKNG